MITIVFLAFLVLSMVVAVIDWRRGWLMAVICGVLQDPARKLTPGTPVVMTLSIAAVYAIILLAASPSLRRHAREFGLRFGGIYSAVLAVLLFVLLGAIRGLFTFGLAGWKAPALSLFIYLVPIPAVILGYAYLQREEQLLTFFKVYTIITSIALIGTPLEYFNVHSAALGTVALNDVYIRHLPGIQIRLLAGFYRAPDIMAWHASMLTIIGIIMTLQTRKFAKALPWLGVIGWGFLNCLISGRRKALYMIAVFVLAFLWRFIQRLTVANIVTLVLALAVVFGVVHKMEEDEQSSVYARGAATTREELLDRLEGGMSETIRQFGILGAGLGSATQGVQHVASSEQMGWQEGGLGKLAIEIGVPGLLAVALLVWAMFRMMMRISAHPDVPGSPQVIRCALFAIVVATVAEFLASAQAYSDVVLTLVSAFFLGSLFAAGVLDERLAAAPASATPLPAPATA